MRFSWKAWSSLVCFDKLSYFQNVFPCFSKKKKKKFFLQSQVIFISSSDYSGKPPYMKMNVTSWQQILCYIQPQDLDLGQKGAEVTESCLCDVFGTISKMWQGILFILFIIIFFMYLFIGGYWEARRRRGTAHPGSSSHSSRDKPKE